MRVTYRYRISVPLPSARAAATIIRPHSGVVTRGVTGALAGATAGAAVGAGAAALVPGVDIAVLAAMRHLDAT